MKRATLRMTEKFLIELLKGFKGQEPFAISIKDPLPEDTECISVSYDMTGVLCLLLKSNDFEEVEKGQTLPILAPQFYKIFSPLITEKDSN